MRYIILILLLKIPAFILPAQNLQSFSSTHHFYGQGKIDNSNISLELDFICRYAYKKGCMTQRYYQISGNCYYERFGIPIQLIGKLEAPENNYFSANEIFEIT